jgi:hypothetical protein
MDGMRGGRDPGYSGRGCTGAYLPANRRAAVASAPFDYDAHHDPSPSTGDTVARAKRTSSERAAARRRYRAATEAEAEALEGDETAVETRADRAAQTARPTAESVRMGIGAALRASVHPLHLREDLASLPSLIPTKALWVPILVTIASTVAIVVTDGTNAVSAILFSYFVQTPGIGGSFLAGFLATRASWLLGFIVGLVTAVCYTVLIYAFPLQIATDVPDAAIAQSAALSAVLTSPILGALFASAAAWYRRFLQLTNPNRGRRNQQPQKRTGDGRTRGAAGQKPNTKAPARR